MVTTVEDWGIKHETFGNADLGYDQEQKDRFLYCKKILFQFNNVVHETISP